MPTDALVLVFVLVVGERFCGDGENVRARDPATLDQLDQQEEGTDRQRGDHEIEQRAAGRDRAPHGDHGQQRARRHEDVERRHPRKIL